MDPNLHMAAVYGNIKPLRRKKRNLEEIVNDQNEDTVLHVHIKFSKTPSTDFVKEILELCPSLLQQLNNDGDTPLHVAAENGRSAMVEFLLKREKDQPQDSESGERGKTKLLEIKNYDEMTVLDKAVEHAKMPVMPMMPKMPMIPMMPMMNNRGKDFDKTVEHDKNAVVKILIKEADHDFFELNDNFRKIINLAAESGDLEMLDEVAKLRGFQPVTLEGSDEMTALSEPFLKSDFLRTQSKDTILHIYIKSIWKRSTKFVEKIVHLCPLLLLETNDKSDTPLHIAARCDKSDIAKFLLQHARNQSEESNSEERFDRKMLKMENSDKNTTFDVAVQCGNIEVVKLLIKEADSDLLDFKKNMNKILHLTANRGDHEMIIELERLNGREALQKAIMDFDIPCWVWACANKVPHWLDMGKIMGI